MGIAESSTQLIIKFSQKYNVLDKHEIVFIRAASVESNL